jgi:large subunit ribosomal protein L6e
VDTKKFDDKYFKKPSKDRSKKSETDFFEEKTEKKELPASYVADNKALDAAKIGRAHV